MNPKINRAFLETLSAYLDGRSDDKSDRLFKAKMDEWRRKCPRRSGNLLSRVHSLPREQRISLTGVEEINRTSRLSTDEKVRAAIASARGFQRSHLALDRVRWTWSSVLCLRSAGPLFAHLSGGHQMANSVGPGTVLAKYRVDWAGVYCIKETPWDQGSPHDEIYVIFTTFLPFRKPWTIRSNVEDNWDSRRRLWDLFLL